MSAGHNSRHGGPRLPPTPDASVDNYNSVDDYKLKWMASPPSTSKALQTRVNSINDAIFEEPEENSAASIVSSPTSMQPNRHHPNVDRTLRDHLPSPPPPPPPRRQSSGVRKDARFTQGMSTVSTQHTQSTRSFTDSGGGHNFGTTIVRKGAYCGQGNYFIGTGPVDRRLVKHHTWGETIAEDGGTVEQGDRYGHPSNIQMPREHQGDNHYH